MPRGITDDRTILMPNRLLALLLPLLLLPFLPRYTAAQAGTMLRRGDEVRVHAPGIRRDRLRGTVILYEGSILEVRERGSDAVLSIPVTSIRELARNEGRDRGRSAWRSARIGGFVGGGAGLVAGPLIATAHAPERFGEIMIVSGVIGLLGGGGIGAVLGTVLAQDHWQRFRMPITAIASDAGRLGFMISTPLPPAARH